MICAIVTCFWMRRGGSESQRPLGRRAHRACRQTLLANQIIGLRSFERLRKKVPLPELAAQGPQPFDLGSLFDTLCDDFLIELYGQSKDQIHRIVTHAVGEQVVDEGAVIFSVSTGKRRRSTSRTGPVPK